MQYTIMGYSQEEAVKLGLDTDCLTILRWFSDFSSSGRMIRTLQSNGCTYYLIVHAYLLEQLPILDCKRRTVAAKLNKLVDAGVLTKEVIRNGGTFTAYGFGPNYDKLISNSGPSKNVEGCRKNSTPLQKKLQPPCRKNCSQRFFYHIFFYQ